MGGADFNWGLGARRAMEDQSAGVFREERGNPVSHVRGDVLRKEEGPEVQGVDIVEASLDIEKEGGHHPSGVLEGMDFVD